MADDIPVDDAQPIGTPQGGGNNQSLYGRIDGALSNIFGPINSALGSVMGPPPNSGDWRQQLLMGLSAIGPGTRMPMGFRPPMPRFNQPPTPPSSNDLILQMLQSRANPHGVLQQTRMQNAMSPSQFRPMSFNPRIEQASRLPDAMAGTRVLTPANRSGAQEYNLSLIRQLMEGGGQ